MHHSNESKKNPVNWTPYQGLSSFFFLAMNYYLVNTCFSWMYFLYFLAYALFYINFNCMYLYNATRILIGDKVSDETRNFTFTSTR